MTVNNLPLAELQHAFQAAVLQQAEAAPGFIIHGGQASAAERFQIYCEAYRLRLIEALAADYPALKACLGDAGFDSLGRAYIAATPSDQFSIRWFGRHLQDYLAKSPDHAGQSALQELAAFEWALSEAFDSPENRLNDDETQGRENHGEPADKPSLHQRLATVLPTDWPALKLLFHPSVRRLDLHCNAPQVWLAWDQLQPLPEFAVATETQAWIVWRQDLKLLFSSLFADEAYALDAFRQGQSFAEVCASLCGRLDETEVAPTAAGYLQSWLNNGWVTGFGF